MGQIIAPKACSALKHLAALLWCHADPGILDAEPGSADGESVIFGSEDNVATLSMFTGRSAPLASIFAARRRDAARYRPRRPGPRKSRRSTVTGPSILKCTRAGGARVTVTLPLVGA